MLISFLLELLYYWNLGCKSKISPTFYWTSLSFLASNPTLLNCAQRRWKIIYYSEVKSNIKSIRVLWKEQSKQTNPDINRILLPQRNDDSLPAWCEEEGNLQTSPREAWGTAEGNEACPALILVTGVGFPEGWTTAILRPLFARDLVDSYFIFVSVKACYCSDFLTWLINTQWISSLLLVTDVCKHMKISCHH